MRHPRVRGIRTAVLFANVARAKWHVFAVSTVSAFAPYHRSTLEASLPGCNYYEGGKRARGVKGRGQTDGGGELFARLAPKQVLWMIARNINGPRASEKVKAACGISPWIILADS